MRKIIFALAIAILLLPDYGFTLGLGEIEVTTALNQELNAEIELLSAVPEDVETLIVKLASREQFSRAGIDRPYLLNSLKFNAEISNGRPIIRVTSDKPIREPFLNFLVEIDWPRGHMMREYTILLDPPIFAGQQAPVDSEQFRPAAMETSPPAPATTPDPQGSSSFRPAAAGAMAGSAPAVPVPTPAAQARAVPIPVEAAAPSYTQTSYQPPPGYRIKRGDTLWSLADAMRPDQTVSIEQMMLAMLRSNPEAFINDNVNGLKRGYILRVPDRDEIITINQADALALVREQNALWREYQQALSEAEPASAMDREAEGDTGAGLDQGADARLEIVAAGGGMSAFGSKDPTGMTADELRAQLAIARESLETERVEKEELQARVEMLEGQVDKMKSLLTLEDADLAQMQQAATPAEAATTLMDEGVEEALIEAPAEAIDEQAEFDEAMAEEAVAPEDALLEQLTATDEASLEEDLQQQVFVDEQQVTAAEEVVEEPVASSEDFSIEPATQPAFMQPKQDPLTALLNNPMLLAAAGMGLLLVLLLIALIMRRRRTGDGEPAVASNLEDLDDQAEDDFLIEEEQGLAESETAAEAAAESAAVVEQEPEDARKSEALAAAEETAAKAPEAEAEQAPRDDVIAEADVYLAYGIYQQAEELLANAIKQNPDNDSYRVKLAETYSASKNTDGFIELATEVDQRRSGQETEVWKKIAAIGAALCPGHALFTGVAADASADLGLDQPAPGQPEPVDIDLGTEDLGAEEALEADLDFGVDETEVAAEPAESLEFDLPETGADDLSAEDETAVEFDLSETGAQAAVEDEDGGLEFDLEETEAVEAGQPDEEEFALDIDAMELGIEEETESADAAFELELGEEAEEELASAEETEDEVFSLDDIGADDLELDIDEEETGESTEDSAAIVDLADMDLDQAVVEAVAEPETAAAESRPTSFFESDDDDELDLSDLDDIDEVGTKLDLAKAYLDMGDADGTRSILDEVMSEGDDTQKKEAEELLRQIG